MIIDNIESVGGLSNIEAEKRIALADESGREFLITYKLIEINLSTPIYVLTAECDGEVDGLFVGNDKNRANTVFSLASEHGVTPGFLAEALENTDI